MGFRDGKPNFEGKVSLGVPFQKVTRQGDYSAGQSIFAARQLLLIIDFWFGAPILRVRESKIWVANQSLFLVGELSSCLLKSSFRALFLAAQGQGLIQKMMNKIVHRQLTSNWRIPMATGLALTAG